MPLEFELYLRIALVSPLAFLALLAYAIVRRYRGLATPTWVAWSAAFLVGFAFSPILVILVAEPIWMLVLALPGVWIAAMLARSGRFRTGGSVVLGMSLPGFVLWSWLYLEDLRDPAPLYVDTVRLWWVLTLVGVVMAIGLVIIGDRGDPVPRVMRRPSNTARDPMALGNALSAAIALGPYPLPAIVAGLVAFVTMTVAVGIAIAVGLPWPVAVLGGTLLYTLVATETLYIAYPREARRAWAAFSYVGSMEMARWRSITGTAVPDTEAKIRAWLRDHDERPETRWAHAELLAVVGRVDDARSMAERIETDTQPQAFERAALLDYIDWIDGAEVDFVSRLRDAERIGEAGTTERLFARGLATLGLARDRAEAGGDWMSPLLDLERDTRPAGWRSFRADTRPRLLVLNLLLGLLVSALATLLSTLLPALLGSTGP